MGTFDNTSPAQGHQALTDIGQILVNLNALRDAETSADASPPSNPIAGQLWRTSDTKRYYMRNQANTAWHLLWFEAAAGSGYGPAWYYPTGEDSSDRNLKTHLDKNITAAVAVHGIKQGSGNGLDADKLDGQHSSAFATSGHTHTGFQSGLDADKLDGQHGTYHRARANHTGTQAISTLSDHNKANHDALGIAPGDSTVNQSKLAYSPGECLIIGADTEGFTDSTSLVKVKEIRVTRKGTARVKFDMCTEVTNHWVYGRVYINGSPVGDEKATYSITWTTYVQEFSVNPGDLVSLYCRKTTAGSCYYRNFRIFSAQYEYEEVLLD